MNRLKEYAGYRIANSATGAFIDLIVGAPAPPEVGQIIFGRFKAVVIEDRTIRVELRCNFCGSFPSDPPEEDLSQVKLLADPEELVCRKCGWAMKGRGI